MKPDTLDMFRTFKEFSYAVGAKPFDLFGKERLAVIVSEDCPENEIWLLCPSGLVKIDLDTGQISGEGAP